MKSVCTREDEINRYSIDMMVHLRQVSLIYQSILLYQIKNTKKPILQKATLTTHTSFHLTHAPFVLINGEDDERMPNCVWAATEPVRQTRDAFIAVGEAFRDMWHIEDEADDVG